jgi:hypothetical protein
MRELMSGARLEFLGKTDRVMEHLESLQTSKDRLQKQVANLDRAFIHRSSGHSSTHVGECNAVSQCTYGSTFLMLLFAFFFFAHHFVITV